MFKRQLKPICTGFFLACTFVLSAAIPTANAQGGWRTVGSSRQMNISGMALIEHDDHHTSFIVVHDNKKKDQGRIGILTLAGNSAPQYNVLEWSGSDVPEDLEAITAVSVGKTKTFMALTAAGSLFHLRLDKQHKSVEVIKSFNVPAIPAGSSFEGFAVHRIGKLLVAVWADRGQDAKPATLFWSRFKLNNYTFGRLYSATVRVPYPVSHVRHITDIKVETTGAVYASAASDPGKDGPFTSAVYRIGILRSNRRPVTFRQPASLMRLFQSADHKVEAIEFVPGPGGGIVFGSDDENLGAAIYVSR